MKKRGDMTQEEIKLLYQDLCVRLPYGVKVTFAGYSGRDDCILNSQHLNSTYAIEYLKLKPYLRPLSSMSDEEYQEFNDIRTEHALKCLELSDKESFELGMRLQQEEMSYLYQRHYDINNLIPKGLALEAKDGMYN